MAESESGSVSVALDGQILVASARCVQMDDVTAEAVKAAIFAEDPKAGTLPVVLDMSGVGMIPSFTVGMLVSVWRQLGKAKRRFILVALQPKVRETLAICRLDKILEICDSLAEAKARLSRVEGAAD
jgi:anti-anti-sigma factor